MNDCVFCKIVRGELPSHKVWEDDNYYAFLSIYPNTEALTLVVPKEHQDSDIFALAPNVRSGLLEAAAQVAHKIEAAYPEVGRVGLVFEGYGVNHVHAKLYPMHGTKRANWEPMQKELDTYFTQYEGYLSTHEGKRAEDGELAEIAAKIAQA